MRKRTRTSPGNGASVLDRKQPESVLEAAHPSAPPSDDEILSLILQEVSRRAEGRRTTTIHGK